MTKVTQKEKETIIKAAELLGVGHSTFLRVCGLREARNLLSKETEASHHAEPSRS